MYQKNHQIFLARVVNTIYRIILNYNERYNALTGYHLFAIIILLSFTHRRH